MDTNHPMSHRFVRGILARAIRFTAILAIALSMVSLSIASSPGNAQAAMPVWQDNFDSETLDPAWYWVNENPGEWSLTVNPGFLTIWTSPLPTGGQNLLLRPAPEGNFVIQTHVFFEPNNDFQFAGLVIWQDTDNTLALGRAFCDVEDICVGNGIYFDYVEDGNWTGSNFATLVDNPSEAYLRLERQGRKVSAYFSEDGTHWSLIGVHTVSGGFKANAVGLTASQNFTEGVDAIPADFDYFELAPPPLAAASPFVGHWQALDVDGGDIRLTIAGPPSSLFQITWTESYFGFCGGEAGIARGTGWLSEGDPYILEAELHLTCFTTGATVDFYPVWRYDPLTDRLTSQDEGFGGFVTTWHRPGETLPLVWQNFLAHPDEDWVEGWGFAEGTVVSLLIRDSAGVNQFAGTAVAYYPEWDPFNTTALFELFKDGYDLKAGDQLWMSDGMVVKYHVVTNLEITETNLLAGSVSGIAEPGSQVIIEYPPDLFFTVTADSSGNWTADVPGLTPGVPGLASQEDEDGDMTRVTFFVPTLDLRVNYGDDWVESFFPAGHTLSITVTESDGVTVKATAEVFTTPRDEWGGAEGFQTRPEDWAPSQPDIQPNDLVSAEADSGQTALVPIGNISGTIDLAADSIEGTILAPWFSDEVSVECFPWGAPEPQPEMKFDTVFPDGMDTYSCAWDPLTEWNIQPGQVVGVGYFGPDGHWVANTFSLP